ncbi:hypothetical protein [Carp edema virus]|nr:hypothetical protein [Carp edema virus]
MEAVKVKLFSSLDKVDKYTLINFENSSESNFSIDESQEELRTQNTSCCTKITLVDVIYIMAIIIGVILFISLIVYIVSLDGTIPNNIKPSNILQTLLHYDVNVIPTD